MEIPNFFKRKGSDPTKPEPLTLADLRKPVCPGRAGTNERIAEVRKRLDERLEEAKRITESKEAVLQNIDQIGKLRSNISSDRKLIKQLEFLLKCFDELDNHINEYKGKLDAFDEIKPPVADGDVCDRLNKAEELTEINDEHVASVALREKMEAMGAYDMLSILGSMGEGSYWEPSKDSREKLIYKSLARLNDNIVRDIKFGGWKVRGAFW